MLEQHLGEVFQDSGLNLIRELLVGDKFLECLVECKLSCCLLVSLKPLLSLLGCQLQDCLLVILTPLELGNCLLLACCLALTLANLTRWAMMNLHTLLCEGGSL